MSVFVRLQRYIAAQNRRIKNERKRRWAQQQRRCNTGTAVKVACQCHRCASVKVYALSNVSSHPHRYKNVPRRNAVERKCERRTSSTVQCRATKVHMENNAEHRQCHGCVVAPLLCHRCNRTRSKFRGSITTNAVDITFSVLRCRPTADVCRHSIQSDRRLRDQRPNVFSAVSLSDRPLSSHAQAQTHHGRYWCCNETVPSIISRWRSAWAPPIATNRTLEAMATELIGGKRTFVYVGKAFCANQIE